MVIIEAVTRLQPEALGDAAATRQDSFSESLLDYPQYTRPAEFRRLVVPEVLRSGNHQAIDRWRRQQALLATARKRPDLLEARGLSEEEESLLAEALRGANAGDAELDSFEKMTDEKGRTRPMSAAKEGQQE
jgi:tRNA (guanine37-N1)-methyltransferase